MDRRWKPLAVRLFAPNSCRFGRLDEVEPGLDLIQPPSWACQYIFRAFEEFPWSQTLDCVKVSFDFHVQPSRSLFQTCPSSLEVIIRRFYWQIDGKTLLLTTLPSDNCKGGPSHRYPIIVWCSQFKSLARTTSTFQISVIRVGGHGLLREDHSLVTWGLYWSIVSIVLVMLWVRKSGTVVSMSETRWMKRYLRLSQLSPYLLHHEMWPRLLKCKTAFGSAHHSSKDAR